MKQRLKFGVFKLSTFLSLFSALLKKLDICIPFK